MKISAQIDKSTSAMFSKDYVEILRQARERIGEGFESDFPKIEKMEKGELEPTRKFVIKNQQNSTSGVKAFAVCLTTEDEELVPMKIYSVIFHPQLKTCTVKDENNETLVCPDEWFLPVELPSKMKEVLEDVEDLTELLAAQKEEVNAPTISLAEMEKEFGIK